MASTFGLVNSDFGLLFAVADCKSVKPVGLNYIGTLNLILGRASKFDDNEIFVKFNELASSFVSR